MVREAESHADEDKLRMAKVEKRNELESYLYNARNSMREEKVKETLSEDDVKKVEDVVTKGISWLDEHSDEEPEVYEEQRKSVETEIQPIMMKLYASKMPGPGPAPEVPEPKVDEVD